MSEDSTQNDLSSDELNNLRALRAGPNPPAALESRVIQSLRQRGPLRRKNTLSRILIASAAALLLLVGGWFAGRVFPVVHVDTSQPRFILLLESSEHSAEPQITHDSQEEQKRAQEYIQWARTIRASGRSVTGERLADSGEALDLRGTAEEQWKPFNGSLEGFFIISAANLAQATDLARRCPHLRYGGRIEVRPIDTP
jgi:hypothetical protein